MVQLIRLPDAEFEHFARVSHELAGIHLAPTRRTLLSDRLRARVAALGLSGFADSARRMENHETREDELPHLLSAVSTNQTYRFRNERLGELLRERLIPEFVAADERRTRAIRTCERVPNFANWKVSIIGSDIRPRGLEKASRAVYGEYSLSRTSPERRKRRFAPVDGRHQLKEEIRSMASFRRHNLRVAFPQGEFDFVLLRNVLTHFGGAAKRRAVAVTSDAFARGGYAYVGGVDPFRTCTELSGIVKFTADVSGRYHCLARAPALAGRPGA